MQLIFDLLPRPVLKLILLHFMRTSDTYQKQNKNWRNQIYMDYGELEKKKIIRVGLN